MAALALNAVKPMYRASLMGNLYASALEGSPQEQEARQAVARSIKKISENPSHGQ
jgi:competence protein ComFB